MCNVISYQFTCPHRLRRRRSPCSGAKARLPSTTTSAPRAACIAESFLTVYLSVPCNTCHYAIWHATWQAKSAQANAYLAAVRHERGSRDVEKLLDELQRDLDARQMAEEWDARESLTILPARPVARVPYRPFVRAPSVLGREVRREDVWERKGAGKEWSEMGAEDYEGDYVASTDPLHPVSTTYGVPGEGEGDDEWVVRYLADGGADEGGQGVGFEWSDTGDWDWGTEYCGRVRRTHYDKQRRLLMCRKHLDEARFYRDWLSISRCEMREYEGMGEGGRTILEPLKEWGRR
ncbi:hypothetical protein DE146DRAFT_730771 [Phaeosphaeria sp. MPI-PUGE-AT-0046c]|nr:hypothetical protein DE146DRAFT_730771 [Phaeosphaeria sp. MPI-PUGE-AT-0046c]